MTTVLLAAIALLLSMILVVLFYHLPQERRSAFTGRAKTIALWVWLGLSVALFGLGILLAWMAVSEKSLELGWIGAGLMLAGLASGWLPAARLDHPVSRFLRFAEFLTAGILAVELVIGRLTARDIALAPVYGALSVAAFQTLTWSLQFLFGLVHDPREKFLYTFPGSDAPVTAYRTRTPGIIVAPFPGRTHRYYMVHEASGRPVSPPGQEAMRKWAALRGASMLRRLQPDWTFPAEEIGLCRRRLSEEMPRGKTTELGKFLYTFPSSKRLVTASHTRTPGIILTPSTSREGRFWVTHEASGLPLADQNEPQRQWIAARMARMIGDAPVDWALPAEELKPYLSDGEPEKDASLSKFQEKPLTLQRVGKIGKICAFSGLLLLGLGGWLGHRLESHYPVLASNPIDHAVAEVLLAGFALLILVSGLTWLVSGMANRLLGGKDSRRHPQ